jgi:hypothetical protein
MFQSAIKLNNIGASLIAQQNQNIGFKAISESLKILKTSRYQCPVDEPFVSCVVETYLTYLSESSLAPNDPSNEPDKEIEVPLKSMSYANMKKLLLATSNHTQNASPILIVEYEQLRCNERFDVIVSIVLHNLGKCLLVMAKKNPANVTLWERTFQMLQCGLDTINQAEQDPMDEVKQTVALILKAQILSSLCYVSNHVKDRSSAAVYSSAFSETIAIMEAMVSAFDMLSDDLMNACASAA